jgi:RNA polymerase sigma-70 factor (ECF subfamily)
MQIPMDNFTDEELIERLQNGHTGALDELYHRYSARLYVFCLNTAYNADSQDAEDLVQDVFLRLVKASHTFKPQRGSFRTWIYRIARNRCIDFNRRQRVVNLFHWDWGKSVLKSDYDFESEDLPQQNGEDIESIVDESAAAAALQDCIRQLGDIEERQALLLYYLEDKVYREIAEILGKSINTAKNRVQNAREKVQRCLKGMGILTPS